MTNIPKTKENRATCVCPECPSYNECAKAKKEALYCSESVGKSTCDYKMNGCICSTCPVYRQFKLRTGYYCIRGDAVTADA